MSVKKKKKEKSDNIPDVIIFSPPFTLPGHVGYTTLLGTAFAIGFAFSAAGNFGTSGFSLKKPTFKLYKMFVLRKTTGREAPGPCAERANGIHVHCSSRFSPTSVN